MVKVETQIQRGGEEFRGYWEGGRAFWNLRRQRRGRGVKMFTPPVVGHGYFLESTGHYTNLFNECF